ncbi:MAG TPA: S9 family peptidase [Candidatus Rothia avistercoris]|uniref:S9 family peptidase n=1 Tax=Candidatus Rothia avistercoris TaxID=2840479 RepID=A0A9D2UGA4_9MICC|nr:S9 family peptidase [Candidatus Rothia avistercoris]
MMSLTPPLAKRVPVERTHHGDTFIDHYEWLRDKESTEVLEHLRTENAFTEAVTEDQQPLRDAIFEEIKGRTQLTDMSVPSRRGAWWYFNRTVAGEQYPVMCRVPALTEGSVEERYQPPVVRPGEPLDREQVVLDCNEFARDMAFFSLGSFQVTRDGSLLTFGVDDSGDERYTQYFKNLDTGEILEEKIEDVFAGAFFASGAKHLIYSVADESWRPYEVRAHAIGTDRSQDVVLYHEADQGMWLDAGMSSSRTHVVITSSNSEYSETRIINIHELGQLEPTLIMSRNHKIAHSTDIIDIEGTGYLVIGHNWKAPNSELVMLPLADDYRPLEAMAQEWVPLVPHREDVRLESVKFSRNHLVLMARENTTVKVFVAPRTALAEQIASAHPQGIDLYEPGGFTEELYTSAFSGVNIMSPVIRLNYTSYLTPSSVYDYFPDTDDLVLRRRTPVIGYEPENYTAYRMWAPAADGAMIPLSVMHRADLDKAQENPVIQYGYGSYESSMDPYFSTARLSVLDRGVIFVVAHIRGGGEMGRAWYTEGKKLAKKNTFTDFIDATDFLASQAWVDAARIGIMGGSAGGLLMGAVVNMAPEKYAACLAQVPFVDALTTILDPNLPLSALEWEEWGNPITDREVYEYMKSYTPYENIRPVRYPAIAAVTSLNDTRVLYVEPAKWVAALRHTIAQDSPTPLLKIEMDGGHGGGSGRYTAWKEIAWDYAFLLSYVLSSPPTGHQ